MSIEKQCPGCLEYLPVRYAKTERNKGRPYLWCSWCEFMGGNKVFYWLDVCVVCGGKTYENWEVRICEGCIERQANEEYEKRMRREEEFRS